jgi:hypothetical protein
MEFEFLLTDTVFLAIVIYVNADKEKAFAVKDNRKKSGIYRWTHRTSGKSYIGSGVDLGRRFSNYFSFPHLQSQAKSSYICKAILKHGYSEFSLEVLEYCEKNIVLLKPQTYSIIWWISIRIIILLGNAVTSRRIFTNLFRGGVKKISAPLNCLLRQKFWLRPPPAGSAHLSVFRPGCVFIF